MEKMTEIVNVPMTPTLLAEIDRKAEAEGQKRAPTTRRLILLGLAVDKQQQSSTLRTEVHYG